MTEAKTLDFARIPGLPGLYARGLARRRRAGPDAVVPHLEATVLNVALDSSRLAGYRRVCGFGGAATLPVTYPQVVAAPLHAALMADAAFPFPMLGLVHVRNDIRQLRPIQATDRLDLRCYVEGSRVAKAGIEFDLVTEVNAGGARAWESVTTVLSRQATRGGKREERAREPAGEPAGALRSLIWRLPPDAGRRYAAISGDYNPIHLSGITARAFGFPRAIAHGMWMLARCVASLEESVPEPSQVDVVFRRPVLLPSRVVFTAHPAPASALSFAVRGAEGGSVHLAGTLR